MRESVKERGVIYTLLKLSAKQRLSGVITISSGSFAYILGFYGKLFKTPVTVVMPTTTNNDYVEKCKSTGANVIVHGNDMVEAHSFALNLAEQDGLFYVDGYSFYSLY